MKHFNSLIAGISRLSGLFLPSAHIKAPSFKPSVALGNPSHTFTGHKPTMTTLVRETFSVERAAPLTLFKGHRINKATTAPGLCSSIDHGQTHFSLIHTMV